MLEPDKRDLLDQQLSEKGEMLGEIITSFVLMSIATGVLICIDEIWVRIGCSVFLVTMIIVTGAMVYKYIGALRLLHELKLTDIENEIQFYHDLSVYKQKGRDT